MRTRAFTVLCAMQLMIILDGNIVTVALPAIQSGLGFSPAGLAWVLNAYLISFAGLLLLAGRLGDLVGTRRVFQAGLAIFTVASLACGLATSAPMLIAGRFAQGIGGALASGVVLSMIVRMYPAAGEQARAMGIYSFVSAAGASIGLVAGGLVTQLLGWQSAFLVNVPIGVAALALTPRLLTPDTGPGLRAGADLLGALLATSGLSLGVFAIVAALRPGTRAGVGLLAVALLAAFVARQSVARTPMLPLRIFRRPPTVRANVIMVLLYATGFGFQFLFALYLQHVLHYDSVRTGLAFLPVAAVIGATSLVLTARLTSRFGARVVLAGGLALLATGLLLLSRAPQHGHYATDLLPVLLLLGLGMGLAIPAGILLAMSGAAPRDAGLASGLVNTTQQAGAAIGLAVLAALAATRSHARSASGATPDAALRSGYHLGFLVAAGFAAIALTVALTARRRAEDPKPQLVPAGR